MAALEKTGQYITSYRARQVNEEILQRRTDLLLAISPWYVVEICRLFGAFSHKVFTLAGYANDAAGHKEIPDRMGSPWARTAPPREP
jgi:protein-tyrosine-phosphatase